MVSRFVTKVITVPRECVVANSGILPNDNGGIYVPIDINADYIM